MSVAPARVSVLTVLGRVRKDGAFSGAALDNELRAAGLGPTDVALATRLVYGVVGAEGVLDEVIDRFVRGSTEPRIRDVLRLATFEILYGRAPAYAIVDQAVSAARRVQPRATGLVNAVLRKVVDAALTFPWGDPQTDRDALGRVSMCPGWIVDEYLSSLGPQRGREALLACADRAPSYVRLDPFAASPAATRLALAPAMPEASPPDPECLVLGRPAAVHAGTDRTGWFSMDAAAQMAPAACTPAASMKVLDAGAGRGNKTVCLQSIAMRSGGSADITAVEVNPGKAERLLERLSVAGVPAVKVLVGDVRDSARACGTDVFDVALLDAPCTGLGTLRRYPEKRWRLDIADVERMARLQLQMITGAAETVRPGGRVVYSTCSVTRAENEGVVRSFLESPSGVRFTVEPIESVPAAWADYVTSEGMFQSWPTSGGPDGHFVAVLRRDKA